MHPHLCLMSCSQAGGLVQGFPTHSNTHTHSNTARRQLTIFRALTYARAVRSCASETGPQRRCSSESEWAAQQACAPGNAASRWLRSAGCRAAGAVVVYRCACAMASCRGPGRLQNSTEASRVDRTLADVAGACLWPLTLFLCVIHAQTLGDR